MRERTLEPIITQDLGDKMVLLGGPRQVGKTTLAKRLGARCFTCPHYLTWDSRPDRAAIRAGRFQARADLLILDELHKAGNWKALLKGLYDTRKPEVRFLVTGSARLAVFRKGGDSLQGRYHYHVLHPFTVGEMTGQPPVVDPRRPLAIPATSGAGREAFAVLRQYGGFPEPMVRQNERALRRWHQERVERVVREDVRDLSNIRDLAAIEHLVDLLPSRVGSLLSLNSLREDLEVAHKSVAAWIETLESLYYLYRIRPFTGSRIRSLKKEAKAYLWDWSEVEAPAARLENLVAGHLGKLVDHCRNIEGFRADLHYLRDVDGREVDFLVTIARRPWFAVEVKTSPRSAKNLRYFQERLNIPQVFLLADEPGLDIDDHGIRHLDIPTFLAALP